MFPSVSLLPHSASLDLCSVLYLQKNKNNFQTNKFLLLLSNLLFTAFLTSLQMMSQFLVLVCFNALNPDKERCQTREKIILFSSAFRHSSIFENFLLKQNKLKQFCKSKGSRINLMIKHFLLSFSLI